MASIGDAYNQIAHGGTTKGRKATAGKDEESPTKKKDAVKPGKITDADKKKKQIAL